MITAVDVGGTKTLIAQFHADGKQPINEVKFPTAPEPATFMRELLEHLDRLNDITAISIGVPGIASLDGTVLRCGNLPWKNFPLQRLLHEQYTCPITVANDADLAGLSEINSLTPLPQFGLYMTVSTGIGVGMVIEGKLTPGLHRTEPGHMVVHFENKWQVWEDIASGSAVKEHFGKLARDLSTPEEWQWLAERMSIGLFTLIPSLQPDVIVFGGGVGHYFDQFSPYLMEKLHRHIPSYIEIPKLRSAQHPEEAVLYGCYHHAIHQGTL